MKCLKSARYLPRYVSQSSFNRTITFQHQLHRFSSPINNDDDATPNKLNPRKTVLQIQESIENNIKKSSLWKYIASCNSHAEWIEKYDSYQSEMNANSSPININDFEDISSLLTYLRTTLMDKYNRFRMRNFTKYSFVSYDEFMFGSLGGFKYLYNLDNSNEKKINQVFTPLLKNQLPQIKNALFEIGMDENDENDKKYEINNLYPFINRCVIYPAGSEANLKMVFRFFVRYYYSLINVNDNKDIIKRYADMEWVCQYDTEYKQNDQNPHWKMHDKGFCINRVDVYKY